MAFQVDRLLCRLAGDETLARGLGDIETRMLVDWAIEWGQILLGPLSGADESEECVQRLIRRSRAICRFVLLWSEIDSRAAALQLAAVERFTWPMPSSCDTISIMEHVLSWEHPPQQGLELQPERGVGL